MGKFVRGTLLIVLLAGAGGAACFSQGSYSYVDPFIGTSKSSSVTKWGNEGGVYPGAVAPWGFVQLSPETRVGDARGYDYSDSSVYYFSCFHHASGFPGGSSGRGFVMPLATNPSRDRNDKSGDGNDTFRLGGYHRPFRHDREKAEPGYYRLQFSDDGTEVEATASERVGVFRFHYPAGTPLRIFIGGMGKLSEKTDRRFEGEGMGYTVIQFDEGVTAYKEVSGGAIFEFAPRSGNRGDNRGSDFIELSIGVSTVNEENAGKNMIAEGGDLAGDFFERVRKATREKWTKQLSAVDIADSTAAVTAGAGGDQRKIFYTALYHALLLPWIVSDADGSYRGADRQVHHVEGRREFGEFSPWDTFRSLHPLVCLLYPQVQREMVGSMLDIYREGGRLPTETMTGDHSIPILVDSWFKGIRGDDSLLVYTAMRKGIVDTPFSKTDRAVYLREGYIPSDHPESVTRSVEYAYDDWALSCFAAEVMHRPEDARMLLERGHYYRHLFDPETLFMLPRKPGMADFMKEPGTIGYKEGDKWVYSYFVPQDGRDLVNLMGGKAIFTERLNSALAGGQILFDNETVFHIPYLFNDAGRPDKTQEWIQTIMGTRFSATPGGLPGNDDLGSMSAWYVLSAMGIFPACPGRPYYTIGAPVFERLSFRVSDGKNWVIKTRRETPKGTRRETRIITRIEGRRGAGKVLFVNSLEVNHLPYRKLWIPHALLMAGGEMVFTMGESPAENWVDDEANLFPDAVGRDVSVMVSGLSVPKKRLRPNEHFWVRFRLHNRGATGTKRVQLYANGVGIGQKNILVKGGAFVVDSIQARLYTVGRVALHIDGAEGVDVNVSVPGETEAAGEVLAIGGIAVKTLVKAGELQTIDFSARNIGGYTHTFYIPVTINERLIATDSLSLAPGEEKNLTHEIRIRDAKEYVVGIHAVKTRFRAYDRDTGSVLLDFSMNRLIGDSLVSDGSGLSNNGVIVRGVGSGASVEKEREREKEKNEQEGINEKNGRTGKNGLLKLGDDCYVEVPNSPSLDRMGGTITMMAWIYPEVGGRGLVDVFSKGDNHVLQVSGGRRLTFFAGGWGRGDCTVELPADWLHHWHHIAGVCDGKKLFVYIDGVLKGESAIEGGVNLSVSSKWNIGRNAEFPGERIFEGYMDKVKVFAEPLSKEEILEGYEAERRNY